MRHGAVVAPLGLLALLAGAAEVRGQPGPEDRTQRESGTHFSAFDVSIGAVMPDAADLGLSYGTGFDVGNLLIAGTTTRFGFRFWSSKDGGVDIDDGVLEAVVKVRGRLGRLTPYAGVGVGAHFVSARIAATPEVQDPRDGFKPGLQLLAGAELTVGGDAFLAPYVEAEGAIAEGVSHVLLQAGLRVRFDRLSGS